MLEPHSAEQQIEQRLDFIVRELDEFVVMANNSETVDLIERHASALGQIQLRTVLMLGFINAKKPSAFRLVRGKK